MARIGTRQWEALERWSPTMFLVGGGLVVGHAAVRGIEAVTPMAPPPDVFGPPGYLLALVGLLGLYPALVDRTPRLARVAAVVAVVPLVGWVVFTAGSFAEAFGVLSPPSDVLPVGFYLAHIVTLILTYVLFGVATLQAEVHSRTVGFLLFGPPVLMSALLVVAAIMGNSVLGAFVIGSGQALVHLAIGGVLRGSVPADSQAPAGDMTAG